MKRIQKLLAVNVIAALIGTGIPAMAAQDGNHAYNRGGMSYESADHQDYRERNDSQMHRFQKDERRDRDRRDYERRDQGRDYRAGHGYGYGYAPSRVYESAPIYNGPVYNDGYYDHRSHNGRTAAIIGGSAVAGALIGAAAGHGQGAVIGAVVGGVAGAAVSAAADHHRR
ncbi:MAG TPA: hypothetical protein VLJ11_07540 [Bryobacteraceae bacterium]|nr:hypothetical protein [Bryobacteraceae bacterium]